MDRLATLERQLAAHSVLLIGEHHGDPEAKAITFELVARSRLRGRAVVLLMEALTEAPVEAAAFERNWGFPWPPYRALLHLCRTAEIPILPAEDRAAPVEERDEVMAQRLLASLGNAPAALHVMLVGADHLEPDRLPAALRRLDPGRSPCCLVTTSPDPSLPPVVAAEDAAETWAELVFRRDLRNVVKNAVDRVHFFAGPDALEEARPRIRNLRAVREALAQDGVFVDASLVILRQPTGQRLKRAAEQWLSRVSAAPGIPDDWNSPEGLSSAWPAALKRWLFRDQVHDFSAAAELRLANSVR